ncbi:STAS domain-containing protein [Spirillospora sp. NPDC047279]|uniref:STAS domain-containing protein n=1 Tax=Spirillospora sp. NPDC047279 TaxID=3155478 RepID=UPI0033E2373A
MTSTEDGLEGPGLWDAHLEVEAERVNDWLVIRAGGDVDFVTAPQLYERIKDDVESAKSGASGVRRIVLDLGDVRFIDSSGLGLIVKLWKAARAYGGDFGIARAKPHCVMLMERTGLAGRIVVAPTVEAAATRLLPGKAAARALATG